MPDINAVLTPDINAVLTPVDYFDPVAAQKNRDIIANASKPDLLDTAAAAFGVQSPVSMMGNLVRWWTARGYDYPVDPGFHTTMQMFKDHADDLPPERYSQFDSVHSFDHFMAVANAEHNRMESLDVLNRAGITGKVLGIGAGLTDPINLIAMAATGGAASALAVGGEAAGTAMWVRNGLAVGSAMTAVEGINKAIDPSVSWWDVAGAGVGGFGFGAGGAIAAKAGIVPRMLATGFGQAIPSTAVNLAASAFDENRTARDAVYSGLWSFGIGGALGAMPVHEGVEKAAGTLRREIEVQAVTDAGLTITPRGAEYAIPTIENPTPATVEQTRVHRANFDRAIQRLDDFAPDHKLNRSEVDAVLEGTGYKTHNQGWPTTEGMRGYIEQMYMRERARIFDEASTHESMEPFIRANTALPIDSPLPLVEFMDSPKTMEDHVRALIDDGWDSGEATVQAERMMRNAERPAASPPVGTEVVPPEMPPERGPIAAGVSPEPGVGEAGASEAGPSATEKLRSFAKKLQDDGAAMRARNNIPRGPNVGASIDPVTEIRGVAKQALGRAIELGITGGEKLRDFIDRFVEENAPHLMGNVRDVHRMVRNSFLASVDRPEPELDGSGHLGQVVKTTPTQVDPDRLSDAVGSVIDRAAVRKPGAYDLSAVTDDPIWMARMVRLRIGDKAIRIPVVPRGFTAAMGLASRGVTNAFTEFMGLSDPGMPKEVVHVSKMLGADGFLMDSKGNAPPESPSRFVIRDAGKKDLDLKIAQQSSFLQWQKDNNMSPTLNPFEFRRRSAAFSEEVARAVRRPENGPQRYTDDAGVNAAANHVRDAEEKNLAQMQEAGVDGSSRIVSDRRYLRRNPMLTKYNNILARFGADLSHQVWGHWYLRSKGVVSDPGMDRMAGEAYWGLVRGGKLGLQMEDEDVAAMAPWKMKEVLSKVFKHRPESEIDQAVYLLTDARKSLADHPSSMQRRTLMDETGSVLVPDKVGALHKLSVEDFLNNDAFELASRSNRYASRKSAMAELLRSFNVRYGLSEYGESDGSATGMRTPEQLLEYLGGKLDPGFGASTNRAYVANRAMDTLRIGLNEATGVPLRPDTIWGDAMKMLRLYTLTKLGGAIGLKHIPQIANAIGEATFPGLLRQFPTIARILTPLAGPKFRWNDRFIREQDGMATSRYDPRLNETFTRGFADSGAEESNNSFYNKIAGPSTAALHRLNFLRYFSRVTSQFTSTVFEQHVLDIAFSKKLPSEAWAKLHGFASRDQFGGVAEQMRNHAEWTPSFFGKRLRLANVNMWKDQDLASAYVRAVNSTVDRVMNAPTLAQTPQSWMTNDSVATMVQFKRWGANAWDNITMHGLQQFMDGGVGDKANAVARIGMAMMLGTLGYAAKEYLRSVGRKDRDKYLSNVFKPERVAAHAFADSGYGGFTPEAADFVAHAIHMPMPFAYGNEPDNPFTRFPAAGAWNDVWEASSRGSESVRAGKMYRQNAQAMEKILPFSNSNLFQQFMSRINANFDERPRAKRHAR